MSHPSGQSASTDAPSTQVAFKKISRLAKAGGRPLRYAQFLIELIKTPAAATLALSGCVSFGVHDPVQLGPVLISRALAEPVAETNRLIVSEPKLQKKGLPVPLGVMVKNSVEGGLVVLGGFVKGTKLSAGHAVGDKNWYLFATDLDNVMIEPPPDFTGTMEISVELLLADTAVVDRHTIRYQWEDPHTAQIEKKTDKKENPVKLPPDEIETLLKRGENLLASGDITAARLVLLGPAEAGDSRAAFDLAKTYDRIVLEKLHAYGLSPDPALAQHWYEKARQLGNSDRTALGRSSSKPD